MCASVSRSASRPELPPIDDALAVIESQITPLAREQVGLEDAYGRFLAEDLHAQLDLPPFDNSAMDGYALRAADTPGRLAVTGESAAGSPYPGALAAGDAVAVSTGAPIPAGADAVAAIEDVGLEQGILEVRSAVAPRAFVRRQGSDIARGSLLLSAHTRIGPAQMGAAAATGLRTLPCRRLPRVAIMTTGSELRQPGEDLRYGEIYDANRPMLRAALRAAGSRVELIPAAADTLEAHTAALERALEHDVVVTSGGVSLGAHDLVRQAGRELGVRELFWRIALRPGKPADVRRPRRHACVRAAGQPGLDAGVLCTVRGAGAARLAGCRRVPAPVSSGPRGGHRHA